MLKLLAIDRPIWMNRHIELVRRLLEHSINPLNCGQLLRVRGVRAPDQPYNQQRSP